jgi:diguanylate cyclase (GGDEF)-like protein
MDLKSIRYRLRNDFQLAILTLLGLITMLGIPPFAAFRLIHGEWAVLALDVMIEFGVAGGVIYAWKTGDTRRCGLIMVYFLSTAATAASLLIGIGGTYWLYPALVANFFLVDRRHALGIALVVLVVLLLADGLFRPPAETVSFVATVIVSCLLTYAFAYRTSTQREQLESLASHDALTGVFNRRTMLDELERAQRTFERDQHGSGVLMLDIDHFKLINDRHGHLVGDQVLIKLATRLEQNIRKNDRLFRYGGEEFVVLALLPNIDGLMTLAEKLRRIVEQNIVDPEGRPVTISIGGAMLLPAESIEAWFARADVALYQAKNSGRNRSIIAPDN